MNYLTYEWFLEWSAKHCKSQEQIDIERSIALANANKVISKLDGVEITVDPIIFDLREFESAHAFALAMDIVGKRYVDADDILVRYTKPENKETHEVYFQFHVLKSKAKIFQRYLKEYDESFEFVLETSDAIKSCVKFFNSLGVKGENGEPLSSKETDYAKDMKDVFKKGENKILVIVKYNDELEAPTLEWELVDNRYNNIIFEHVKNKINNIIQN